MNEIKYHLAVETIDRSDLEALAEWFLADPIPRLTMGPKTYEFERRWSDWLGTKHALACNSGSSANLLMYSVFRQYLDNKRLRNKKVIVPSVGWATTIMPAIQLGFQPIMCEADFDTLGLDLNHLESLLKENDPAIVVMVQVLGVPHKMREMLGLKGRYGFFLLEDACASAGSSYCGRNVGTFGDMSSFSFYFGHQTPTIEGGMVCTDNSEFYNILAMMRAHGWGKDTETIFHRNIREYYGVDDFHFPFVFYVPGYNVRITDLQSFLGIRQIARIKQIIERRASNHRLYSDLLSPLLYIQKPEPDSVVCSIHFGAMAHSQEERRAIISALEENGISTRLFSAGNLGRHPFWVERYGVNSFPTADRVHNCGFFLPNHPSLTPADIVFIAGVVKEAMLNFREERVCRKF